MAVTEQSAENESSCHSILDLSHLLCLRGVSPEVRSVTAADARGRSTLSHTLQRRSACGFSNDQIIQTLNRTPGNKYMTSARMRRWLVNLMNIIYYDPALLFPQACAHVFLCVYIVCLSVSSWIRLLIDSMQYCE